MPSDLYQARAVCDVCAITPRRLDYWITSGLIQPTSTYRPRPGRRRMFLFTFEDMVQIRVIQSLRDAGITLKAIRFAVSKLRRKGNEWQADWLIVDGRRLLHPTSEEGALESLSQRESGQLVFSAVALKDVRVKVQAALKMFRAADTDGWVQRRNGRVVRYARLS